jgi:Tfp pilus assembly protein PilP
MVEINLLPWRGYLRAKQKKNRLLGLAIVLFALACGWYFLQIMAQHKMAEAKSKTIKQMPSTQHQVQQPHAYSVLHEIKFVGYLRQQNRQWGLVKLPNGVVRDVQVGTVLMPSGARVLSITPTKMIVILPDHQQWVVSL